MPLAKQEALENIIYRGRYILTFLARFSTPADKEQHGYAIDFRNRQRQNGVDDVAEPRVLQIYDRGFPGA